MFPLKPIFLKPVLKKTIWGGNRLETEFGWPEAPGSRQFLRQPENLCARGDGTAEPYAHKGGAAKPHTGEGWVISAHSHGDCPVENEEWKGETLGSLWNSHRELFGNLPGKEFPLLVKIIDAGQDLSIQVHPDDSCAAAMEHGARGKTECWYILDCAENEEIVIGHRARTERELRDMVLAGQWENLLRTVPVKPGQFFQIPPGCIHAIKAGTLVLETQQNSDITYRLYDYGRMSGGKARELHTEKAMKVIKAPFAPARVQTFKESGLGFVRERLISCPCYTVWKTQIRGKASFRMRFPFLNVTVIEGEGAVNGIEIGKGMSFVLPGIMEEYKMEGSMAYIASAVPEE